MSEPIPACVAIGGRLPASSVPAFCEAIIASRVTTEWGGPVFAPGTAAELLDARQTIDGVSVLWLCNDQASWGRLRLLEQFLENEQLPFDLRADGVANYDPDRVYFRPGSQPISLITDANGRPVVVANKLQPVVETLSAAHAAAAQAQWPGCLTQLSQAQSALLALVPPTFSPLPSFEIV